VVSDSTGRFHFSGDVSLISERPGITSPPRFTDGALWLEASAPGTARMELFTSRGESLASSTLPLKAGMNRLDAFAGAVRAFAGYVRVAAEGQTWVLRALRVPGPVDWVEGRQAGALAKSSAGGNLSITAPGLAPKTVPYASDDQDLGDITMDYTERHLGVGAAPIFGATVLFDGSKGRAAATAELQSKWQDWPRFTPSAIMFRIVRDPQYPNDTGKVALQSCCNKLWGYDDIQAKIGLYQDCQIHVEWVGMGEYDTPFDSPTPNANATDPFATDQQKGYFNSGVYAGSRYEIQIMAWDTVASKIPGTHDVGAIVDDEAPSVNPNRPAGVWQAYDITFRAARFNGNTMSESPYMTVWWNGTMVHNNHKVTGTAAGLANHSGEEHTDKAIYGLKLQSEGRDVRFRNVWIKKLVLSQAQTNLGY